MYMQYPQARIEQLMSPHGFSFKYMALQNKILGYMNYEQTDKCMDAKMVEEWMTPEA